MPRNFGLKKKEPTPPRLLKGATIFDACIATSNRLNDLLGTHDIDVRVAGLGEDNIEGNLVGGWLKAEFHWHTEVQPYHDNKDSCYMGLFKNYNLLGMCEIGLKFTATRKISVDILFIESHPDPQDNPLRGYVIPAFAEATLQMAKASGVQLIGVDRPSKKTVHQYKILGYNHDYWENMKLLKGVSPSTELDWRALLARRQKQGFGLNC